MRHALLVLSFVAILAASPALAQAGIPAWVDDTFAFSFSGEPGARWSITIDGDGHFQAGVIPDAALAPVCAGPYGPCATNADACSTSEALPTCEGAANGIATHTGPFTLLGFTGTLAQSPTGGSMSDKLVYSCTTYPSCRPTNTVEFHCDFAPGTLHLVEVWGSEGGECNFGSWDSNLVGNTFAFSGSQTGDLDGVVSHTVN